MNLLQRKKLFQKTTTEIKASLVNFSKRRHTRQNEAIFLKKIENVRLRLVEGGLQEDAKELWILKTIYLAQNNYIDFISLLKKKKYYEAWCVLERCEINLKNLMKHIPNEYIEQLHVDFLVHQVPLWQEVYPYKIFASSEFLEKKIRCSECKQLITPRSSCSHLVGEVYNGKLCYRIIEDMEILGIAMVPNPVQKICVPFKKSENGEDVAHYNYQPLDMIVDGLPTLFYWWEINHTIDMQPRSNFDHMETNELCPCGSGRQFIICCSSKEFVLTPHKEIVPLKVM
ncbi:nucleic acid-binding protein [Photobacterium damselae]|uniref:SEC-C motif domain protein n=2 Tax=Photobacterium damselae TaxID=38293 RepID=D0Z1S5_PHODD|nr:SEC-C motif domain protein [Photobacterium damselae subsp. damselae CIP 102761]PSW86366.1 nucleic acid-binding protein [Photobacterium damselae]SPY29375.1 Uncharacterised protein [Photobacterium damselae]